MPARITIERLLRDSDDDTGQSVRDWKIESEPHGITIRLKHGNGFLIIPRNDIEMFAADVQKAKNAVELLAEEEGSRIR